MIASVDLLLMRTSRWLVCHVVCLIEPSNAIKCVMRARVSPIYLVKRVDVLVRVAGNGT
jgi:hypothetical protein